MKIRTAITLTVTEKNRAQKLLQQVHAYDHTYSDPYLSNEYNYFKKMPTFVLAEEGTELIGLVMLYADDSPGTEVDLHVNVLPEFRRQGIAQAMLTKAQKILHDYSYHDFYYPSENNFLQQHPQFLAAAQLKIAATEYHMVAVKPKSIMSTDQLANQLSVRSLQKTELKQVAQLYSQAFATTLQSAIKYLMTSWQNANQQSLVLLYQHQIVGYCAVDLGQEAYIFGLFIAPKYQRHGFATCFLKKMMQQLQSRAPKFVLDVESDNQAAIHAYQNAGFRIRGQNVYLQEKN